MQPLEFYIVSGILLEMAKKIDSIRTDNYYLETYLAVSKLHGGSLNQVGKQVALSCNIDSQVIINSDKSDNGYVLESSFRKTIDRALKNLVTDSKVFKRFVNLDGNEVSEDDVGGLKGSQYRVFFYSTMGNYQIVGENLLINSGITLYPLNNRINYHVDLMREDNPLPIGECSLLFINDYHWAINLKVRHAKLPIKFILAHKNKNIQDIIREVKIFAKEKSISLSRAAIICLENTSYDLRGFKSGYIEIDFSSNAEVFITNHTNEPLDISFDGLYHDPILVDNVIKNLLKSDMKESAIFNYLCKEGYYKENVTSHIKDSSKSQDISPFSPAEIEFLRYKVVLTDGLKSSHP